jgi:hypothetical protein
MRAIKALRAEDFELKNDSLIDGFLDAVTTRLSMFVQPALPTASQIPNGQWGIFKNTTTGFIYLVVNDNNTIKKVQLT